MEYERCICCGRLNCKSCCYDCNGPCREPELHFEVPAEKDKFSRELTETRNARDAALAEVAQLRGQKEELLARIDAGRAAEDELRCEVADLSRDRDAARADVEHLTRVLQDERRHTPERLRGEVETLTRALESERAANVVEVAAVTEQLRLMTGERDTLMRRVEGLEADRDHWSDQAASLTARLGAVMAGRTGWDALRDRLAALTPSSAAAYGVAENHVHVTEEIGELITELGGMLKVLNKHRRGFASGDDVAEEVADVVIIGTCIVAQLVGLDGFAAAFARKLSKGEGRLRDRGFDAGDPNDRTWVPESEWRATRAEGKSRHFTDESVAAGRFPSHNGPNGPVYAPRVAEDLSDG